MQVVIRNVEVEWNGAGAKRWGKAVVSYSQNGRDRKQNVMSFGNPAVFKQVQEMVGQTVEVEVGKNEKGYDEWKSISTSASGAATTTVNNSATTTRVSGSNYETKEERAARQVLIVKQSSLSSAVATLSPGAKGALDPNAVLDLAQRYTDWVFEKPELVDDKSGFDSMGSDLDF